MEYKLISLQEKAKWKISKIQLVRPQVLSLMKLYRNQETTDMKEKLLLVKIYKRRWMSWQTQIIVQSNIKNLKIQITMSI